MQLKTRSLITVAMRVALGKQDALKGPGRGAPNYGATPAEVQAVLQHAAACCGVPSAVDAFAAVAEMVDAPKTA